MFSADQQQKAIQSVTHAIETIKAGKMVIMVDDEDRENEGDLVIAADCIQPEHINFMAKEARGLICLTLEPTIIDKLKLPMMEDTTKKDPEKGTAFTVSIEARFGVTTGISAADRAKTIKVAIDENTKPEDIVVPGHIFPLKAKPGGVLERAGHTEGSVDIAKMAGFSGAGVICEIMNDDGTMARVPDLEKFSKKFDIPIVTIDDLITYRLLKESLVQKLESKPILTKYGVFESIIFQSIVDGAKHIALVNGDNFEEHIVDIRVHNQRPLIDVFGEETIGGRFRIDYGLQLLAKKDHAAFIYITHPDKGQRFEKEISELAQDVTVNNNPNSDKNYQSNVNLRLLGTGAQIIRALGIKKMRIHATGERNFKGLSGFGLTVCDNILITRGKSPTT